MVLFGNKNTSEEITLIFDVGSSSVGGAIVRYQEDTLPQILFTARKGIEFKYDFDYDRFYKSMLDSLESVTVDILTSLSGSVEEVSDSIEESRSRVLGKRSKRKIKNIFCVFSSPWYMPRVVDVHNEFENETQITSDVIIEIVKGAAKDLKKEIAPADSISLLEERILEYKLNGYSIDDPLSSTAKTADLKLYFSAAAKQTLSAVKEPIRKNFSYRKIRTFSFMMAYFSVMRDMHPAVNSFAVFDFRGEVSELAVIENDILVSTVTVQIGKNELIRELSSSLNIDLFEATTKLNLYFAGKLTEGSADNIRSIVEEKKEEMKNELLNNIEKGIYIPNTSFVLADMDMEDYAADLMNSIYLINSRESDIKILTSEYFDKFVTFSKSRYKDHFLSLESLFFRPIVNS
ncbi:MAG: hypothetical protein U5L75_02025 [Candidatus Campbellbacteria bacterium]|nr:hypothetical protein [Candidatus Campbellbacteria bacterium]